MSADPALKSAVAVSTPSGVNLEGHASNLDARAHALSLAKATGEKNTNDDLGVTDRRMVAIEVRFAAVSTSTMKSLGINLQKLGSGMQFATGVPGSISSATLLPSLDVTSSLPISQAFNLLMNWPGSDFATAISALSSVNLAQVLAEPTLMVRSGDQADFLAGGEIPIPITQSGQTNGAISIEYKKFGVQLHVRATVLGENRIVLRVNPEVSELDTQNALTLQGFNVPAIRVRSTDTNIELGNGQSFVIAGLMYSNHSNVEEKVPGLGDLPIVGDFFKRSQNSAEEQELIIVATPRLVSPMAAASVPKLPGEGFSYAPTAQDMLTNTRQLDDFVAQYGLAP
jgi:pilus assembly protein CpaC